MVDDKVSQPTPRRRAPRVPADRITLRLDGIEARLVDLSEQGMRFLVDRSFEPGSIVAATLTAGEERLAVEGVVRWCEAAGADEDGHAVGVAFRGSNPQALRQGVLNLFLAAG